MEINKIGRYSFRVETFHTDIQGNLSLPTLGNHLLNVADRNASGNVFGMSLLQDQNRTWVLSRLVMEYSSLPKCGETFEIETWIENVFSLFSARNYAFYDSNNTPIGYARSIWAMIDKTTRQPLNLPQLSNGIMLSFVVPDKPCPIDKPSKLLVKSTTIADSFKVQYSDLDINGHLNSIRYIEHILNLFPPSKYQAQALQRFEIAYSTEAFHNEILNLYMDSDQDTNYRIDVRNANNQSIVRAGMRFIPN